ncbi:MAG: hypothetical protein HGB05_09475 [Chloroflexi bacterium]|nr:hypothetical protein [Chloroflexota bacterium]
MTARVNLGDILADLRVEDLRSAIGMPGFGENLNKNHPLLAAGPPTNQQILDATRTFYANNQELVDTSTNNAISASSDSGYVASLNAPNWKGSSGHGDNLTQPMQDVTSTGIFGATGGGDPAYPCTPPECKCKGIFGDTLCKQKASGLFSTISVGVSAEIIFLVGGYGGLGCAWDIAKRESPKGYGYVTGELGLKVAADFNLQVAIFNKLPSQLNVNVFGLNVGVYYGPGASFTVFMTDLSNLTILGYAVAVGVGVGGGAAVFGGHVWNFG